MPAIQDHVTASTPMGATLVADGATFRVWAPGALRVFVVVDGREDRFPGDDWELVRDPTTGHWTGFHPGVEDGDHYRFLVVGPGGTRLKRDPWARELELEPLLPDCDCLVRDPGSYPWHDGDYRPPAFPDLVVYQLHVGVFYAVDEQGADHRPYRVAKFLDALSRVEYLADLGVNAVQPLPFVEFHGEWSLGYNGTDLFSPETDYCVSEDELPRYLDTVNTLLARAGHPGVELRHLTGQVNQLKAFVDVCHVYGLAVIPDVVYNHAGGDLDPHSLDYFDMPERPGAHNNLYFTDRGWAGGRVFAFARPEVQDFLISNARLFLDEYHVDGLRFDEVSVIDREGGWSFCQAMTGTLRYHKPGAALIAEYWGDQPWRGVAPPPHGMGFDLAYSDALRDAVRGVVAQAAGGAGAAVDLEPVRRALLPREGFPWPWQPYNCVENHDLVLDSDGDHRKPRVARLADPTDARSWYARSRGRVAMGLLVTAAGVPMLFMGQEFLEDKLWSDNPTRADLMLWWDGLVEGGDRHMADFLAFTRAVIAVRRAEPALRAGATNVLSVDADNRVIAFHRWLPGEGRDVVVVASLRESTFHDGSYRLGFPLRGRWDEVLNSDAYDHFPNPEVQGNAGWVDADGPGMHGMPWSAALTIPANSILVFARRP